MVIGAQAMNGSRSVVAIGAGAVAVSLKGTSIGAKATSSFNGFAAGYNSLANGISSVAIGAEAKSYAINTVLIGTSAKIASDSLTASENSTVIGYSATASAPNAVVLGANAKAGDAGATVIRSTAEDGTYTQLYFSGANTPLANTYENGEAMMGYVVRDSAGNVMTDAEGNAMVGTQKLSVLFPNNRGENAFTPAMLGLDDSWTPKPMFRPSDLDMPQEEPTEPEEYTPLPVYPIVEPEIEDLTE